jgi:predicted amidohydrolase YtcJ
MADFVILDKDLMIIPCNEILGVNVLSTWVGGKIVM